MVNFTEYNTLDPLVVTAAPGSSNDPTRFIETAGSSPTLRADEVYTTFSRLASPDLTSTMARAALSTFAPPLARMPLLPTALLRRHACHVATDTRFRAAARYLQHLWRSDRQLPIGLHTSISGAMRTRIRLGSRLRDNDARAGHNFISPEVYALVRRELVLREEGAAIDEDRLLGNALSSMPLAFNVFGPMALDLALASDVWRRLLPDFVGTVERIGFEHSPGRGDARYLDDVSAFDVVLSVVTPEGEPAVVFIEVKYSESMNGPSASPRPRYDRASHQVRFYRDPDSPVLRSTALEQLWREHMLAQLAVDLGAVHKARFVAIGPRLNRRVAVALRLYADQLLELESEDSLRVEFTPLTLEAVIEAMADAGAAVPAQQLWGRYLDFSRVLDHALADGAAAHVRQRSPRSATRPAARALSNRDTNRPAKSANHALALETEPPSSPVNRSRTESSFRSRLRRRRPASSDLPRRSPLAASSGDPQSER